MLFETAWHAINLIPDCYHGIIRLCF